ncbi:hypothetical protein conserved [Leishmania donovani]|uniref:Hypothetical_protein_conserved n=1 Tax=Leishmania donovani TaxID=5661 RepID=A0A504X2P7_LEIDO|nr:hypothetical protein, conserved [Leishmania donovani]TPP41925.1 hypothetical protein CGC21_18460 [Leishmania donovani]TPP42921.1 hypothetical protein CGC20_8430 [Leishmania donovani]CAJ1986518.1 hypothetical protein conserved [Leishmania donovani]CBZ31973.1 hypothetical protein, conserved [Leishmania donovani]VDZ42414.1 hypothetical_protein_conserved [Leishmania donovani]
MAEVRQQQSSRAVSNVVEYLQLAGRRYREHVELLRQEQAVRDAQHAPFKPNVSLYAERVGKSSLARQSSSIGARLHELHQKKLALLEEEAQEEAKRRAAAEAQDCPFSPTVTPHAARSRRTGSDVAAALMQWGEQRRARQARAQVEAARDELSKVSAAPRITAYADEKARAERGGVSVEVSLTAEAEARRQRRHAAFEKAYPAASSSSGATSARRFSPSISAYASRIEFEEDVVSRLYERHGSRGHLAPRDRLYDEEVALYCTFHPKLSARSTELSRRYYEEEGEADTDPHERLFRNTHHASKYRKPAQLSVFTGQPEISDASRRIVEERRRQLALDGQPGALGLSPGSRLCPGTASFAAAQATKTSKKKVLSARDTEAQETVTFTPSVSPASEALWRQRVSALKASGVARNTEEARQLLWRKAEKRKEEEVLKLQDQRRRKEAAECTFRPKAGRPPQRSSGYVAMPVEARAALWAQQRDRHLADLRTELSEITVEECTFRPHVDPVFPLPRGDAKPAWGVEAFLERQAEARRQREEAEQWWRPKYARAPVARTSRVSRWRSPSSRGASQPSTQRTVSASRRSAASSTASEAEDNKRKEEGVFEQHWARPPASTSLTASSFSRVSQQEVPSAESSPAYVAPQQPNTLFPYTVDISPSGPYPWRPTTAAGASEAAAGEGGSRASAAFSWRKPLRYRPISATATASRGRSSAL